LRDKSLSRNSVVARSEDFWFLALLAAKRHILYVGN
jgi:hypothetical protein